MVICEVVKTVSPKSLSAIRVGTAPTRQRLVAAKGGRGREKEGGQSCCGKTHGGRAIVGAGGVPYANKWQHMTRRVRTEGVWRILTRR